MQTVEDKWREPNPPFTVPSAFKNAALREHKSRWDWPDFQRIAIRILTVGTSSLASERNFSTFAHVWNNRSNALSFETANMLVFCWHNIRALHQLRTGSAPKQTVAQAWLLDEIDEE